MSDPQDVARLMVPTLADWFTIDVLGADGTIERMAVAHVDPAKITLAHELCERQNSCGRETCSFRKV